MMFTALPTGKIRTLQRGGKDANDQPVERATSDGQGNPCRHCLKEIPEGAEMLILSYRPFESLHPYAETGPIFLCAAPCAQGGGTEQPEILTTSPDYLVKGYSANERIVYGTGAIVPADQIFAYMNEVFNNSNVAYAHVRSARNNCYQLRIDRD